MVQNYFATHLAPVWQALRDETQTALLAGLAGGIAILVILTLFPGDPFDYGAGDDGNAEGLKKYRDAYERARQRGEKPPPMPTPTELKKPEAKKEKDPPLVIDEERLAEKARQAEKLFGIKAEQYKQAVVEATAEANAGVSTDDVSMDLGGGGSMLLQRGEAGLRHLNPLARATNGTEWQSHRWRWQDFRNSPKYHLHRYLAQRCQMHHSPSRLCTRRCLG